jgi:dTDP-glucose pyrophosphorylase
MFYSPMQQIAAAGIDPIIVILKKGVKVKLGNIVRRQ